MIFREYGASMSSKRYQYDVVVVGAGAAGMSLALSLPPSTKIALLSKTPLNHGSTYWAQGGMAAVVDAADTIESHVQDTLVAGAGLCQRAAVEFTVSESTAVVEWLVSLGVPFDRLDPVDNASPNFHLTQEGGHSHRRILHAADATGKAISRTLSTHLLAANNIDVFTEKVAVDAIVQEGVCRGLYALDRDTGQVDVYQAKAVVLATGGASKAYLYTSNPDGNSGDGIAIAWRAGCRVANMEFNQFHPTCLFHPKAKSYLITEAIRGEGGHLLLPSGERFMHRFDPRAELAPRDIVARAIDHEMKRLGADHLLLDISHKPTEEVLRLFPNTAKRCAQFGIDITKEPIPIVPAAHYTCGGVIVDQFGCTDIEGLYAIGETSHTGLHGANRMASNSLLECLVYGRSAAQHIQTHRLIATTLPLDCAWDESQVTDSDEDVVISHNWDELRRFMWDYVGIVRSDKRLERAQHRCDLLNAEIHEYYSNYRVSNDLLELRNLVVVADLMIRSARARKESRGLHYTLDYPHTLDEAVDTVLSPTV